MVLTLCREQAIRERAYRIWEQEAHPDGSNNRMHKIAGCVDTARKELEEGEARYIAYVTKIMGMFTSNDISKMSDQTRRNHISALTKGHKLALAKRRISIAEEDVYIYWSYIFHRALRFRMEGKTTPAKKDCNDYEDSYICLHLHRETAYCFVTNDEGARRALEETVSLLARLNDPQFRTTLNVRNAQHLRDL
jgi:hypothetical protein